MESLNTAKNPEQKSVHAFLEVYDAPMAPELPSSETYERIACATKLEKPGLRINLPSAHRDLAGLVEDAIVSYEDMENYSFVVLENYGGQVAAEPQEKALKDDTTIQFIHRDMPEAPKGTQNVIAMRYPRQEVQRRAYTLIGDTQTILRRTAEFVLTDTQPATIHALMQELQDEIRELGIHVLRPDLLRPDGTTWGDHVFCTIAQTVRAKGYERLPMLYRTIDPYLHFHVWHPDQLLLLNDRSQVHGRLPMAPGIERADGGGVLFRSRFNWKEKSTNIEYY